MKQFTVEITSSILVRRRHELTVLADSWPTAQSRAIDQVRKIISDKELVVGDPKKIKEEEIEEVFLPTGSSN